jgi:hypothetical protein
MGKLYRYYNIVLHTSIIYKIQIARGRNHQQYCATLKYRYRRELITPLDSECNLYTCDHGSQRR